MNYDAFDQAKIIMPEVKIPVPELRDFFDDGEKPEWVVRMLTGSELATVNQAHDVEQRKQAIIEAINSSSSKKIKAGINSFLENDSDIAPADLVRRHKMLELASIPKCPEHLCVKLAHTKPGTFFKITNKIISLTGDGADLGK